MTLHPQFIEQNGVKYAMLPLAEYSTLFEIYENYLDEVEMKQAKEKSVGQSTFTHEDVMARILAQSN